MNQVLDRPHKEKLFLEAVAEGMSATGAAARADLNRVTVYRWRSESPEFAAAWEEAKVRGVEKLEDEALRRATEGVEEIVYHGGAPVGVTRKYSDLLLIFLLKALRPDKYRENISIKQRLHVSEAKDDDNFVDEILQRMEDFVKSGRAKVIDNDVKAHAANGEEDEQHAQTDLASSATRSR